MTISSTLKINVNNPYLPGVVFIPGRFLITGITQSMPMQISFTVPSNSSNTYVPGQLIRLFVPRSYGMYQADGLTAKIMSVQSITLTVNVNSLGFDAFVIPSDPLAETPASFVPAGAQNLTLDNTTAQVPFQPLNNTGN